MSFHLSGGEFAGRDWGARRRSTSKETGAVPRLLQTIPHAPEQGIYCALTGIEIQAIGRGSSALSSPLTYGRLIEKTEIDRSNRIVAEFWNNSRWKRHPSFSRHRPELPRT